MTLTGLTQGRTQVGQEGSIERSSLLAEVTVSGCSFGLERRGACVRGRSEQNSGAARYDKSGEKLWPAGGVNGAA